MRVFLPFSLLLSIPCFATSKMQEEGKSFAQIEKTKALKQAESVKVNELASKHEKPFNQEEARKKLESHSLPSSEFVDFLTSSDVRRNERENKHFHPNELFLKTSEEIANRSNLPRKELIQEPSYSLHTCRQAGDPVLITTQRSLNVHFTHHPEEKKTVCLGHSKSMYVENIGDFSKSTRKNRHKFKNDSSIKSYHIDCTGHWQNYYIAWCRWKHVDNAEGCDNCRTEKIKEENYQENGEEWVFENSELWNLSKSADSTIIEHQCLDSNPKTLHGQQVHKPCWKERLSFLYRFPKVTECDSLRNRLCEQVSQTCIQQSAFGCAMWELTFKCLNQINRPLVQTDLEDFYGLKDSPARNYLPNRSFAEVATKLAVFNEAKKELEKSNALDPTTLQIFKGQRMTCSKSVADHLIYDCCFSDHGLAKQMGLAKCNADEIGLAEMREQGLCHYIGSYEEKMLGLWKSRDEHVYCCFPTKLARLVQEEGRKQLRMGWGTPKESNCGGFSSYLLSRLDFNKMDLSELFDEFPNKIPEGFQEKMEAFQNRLQEEIQKEEPKMEEKRRGRES